VPYYTTVFGTSLATAGLLAAVFSFPSGVVRALGGWMSDRWGARRTMYGVLGVCVVGCFLLSIPSMRITTPGEGVSAKRAGVVTAVTESAIGVGPDTYPLRSAGVDESSWAAWGVAQEPAVRVGERVQKKQVLARGTTTIRVEPSIVPFTFLVFLVGLAMGVGKAAVYKYIPEYFPGQVGAVGGLVGVIGGLGGFVCPILFGYLLRSTGLWTSSWAFLFALSVACLAWLHVVVGRIEQRRPRAIEGPELAARRSPPLRVPARGVVS